MVIREVTEVITGPEVKERLIKGSSTLKSAVATTFGPYGRNVGITKVFNPPHVTKDGVTVAGSINLKDPVENVACSTVKEASKLTARIAGDGTSSTVIVSDSLISSGFKLIESDVIKPMQLKRELDGLLEFVEAYIDNNTTQINSEEDVYNIAMVASNSNEYISKMVTDAYKVIKQDGVVRVKNSNTHKTFTELVDGIKIEQSHISSTLANGNKTEYEDPKVLVTDFKFKGYEDADFILEAAKESKSPLLVVCQELDDKAVESILWANNKGGLDISVIGSPFVAEARKEVLEDIAIATGATLLTIKTGWTPSNIRSAHFGSADSISISSKDTDIIGRHGDEKAIEDRIEYYREKIEADTDGLAENYKKRLAILNAGSAVIYVGGNNPVEVKEKRDSIDDTVRAVQAALEFGVVDGGGKTYVDIAEELASVNNIGSELLRTSLWSVPQNILANGGYPYEAQDIGNFHDKLENIKDPMLVVKTTIRNAISAAGMILTTDCIIHQIEEDYERD